ncbi:MAG: tetratricopeptide repeat protein [Gammaproteobacteria bacterium]|nr:tetratricopeptide repeat protein [Pseudomonadales bacterium]MCB1718128.1 tetratricopeptide repeat protein [Candidatus Competibacteraceae bacterium]MCP5347812.1 tetratricopeptide repeat protein [Pseudomonadales bacterium]
MASLLLMLVRPVLADCPDLTVYYPGADPDWVTVRQQLAQLMPACLDDAEFFALYGAAQLNSGEVPEALEMLERALLLDPDNGAAQIDYAQALFLQGDLFAALELNNRLLEREDLPANLREFLQGRGDSWSEITRQRLVQLDILAGYDRNLNSAPDAGEVTLTLSGEDVVLALNPEFRPISGPYLNLRLGARFRELTPDYQHNWLLEARARNSEDSQSDQLQLDLRYAVASPGRQRSWQLETGISHLLFGGNHFYTASEAGVSYQLAAARRCRPYLGITLQHQLFHNNSSLNAVEGKAGGGLNCPRSTRYGEQLINLEFALLENTALKSSRPGGQRQGWQSNLNWRASMKNGVFLSQLSHTRLRDREGYNPLLESNAERWTERTYLLLQYRWRLTRRGAMLINFFHQYQRSNITLFDNTDTTIEIGFSIDL